MRNTRDCEFLGEFFRGLGDPGMALDPERDDRYVHIYDGPKPVDNDPVEELARTISWSAGESVQLLSGFRGTGKSTELRRLKNRLESDGKIVLLLDMEEHMNMTTPIDITDFLIVLAGSAGDALAARDKLKENPIKESYWTRFVAFLKRTNVTLGSLGTGGEADADVKIELHTSPTFRQRVQQRLAGQEGALYQDVAKFFQDCVEALRTAHARPALEVVIIVDSIDHIRGSHDNADKVHASVESLFSSHAQRLKIPNLHLVYTVPHYLKVRYPNIGMAYNQGSTPMFPAIKVHETRSSTVHENNLRALRRIVLARGDALKLLGTEERLRKVLLMSGGHLRDMLRLLRGIALSAKSVPIDDATLETAINKLRWELVPISDENALWLAEIAESHEVRLLDNSRLAQLATFFDTNVVLCYADSPEWYDVHPLIREIVIEQAARIKREAKSK
ncbi:MAG TPA: hypothetical protein PK156_06285 [Polyangium sp.]|nr:hypothetical protein [Polyangium sp.]